MDITYKDPVMNEKTYQNIKDLVRQYASDKLTTDKLQELKQTINRKSDDELKPVLEEEWEEWQDCLPLPATEKKIIFAKIRQQTKLRYVLNWRKQGFQIAASVIIILLTIVSIFLYTSNQKMTQLGERNVVVKVGKGERVSVTLPDGTHVRLNSESVLSYQQDFGLNGRNVSLTGEGYFEVVKNKEKSFVVNTEFLDILVMGTKFNVYTYATADSVEMALVEGNVQVTAINPPHQSFNVKPNEKIVYNKKMGDMRIEASFNLVETAWISNELVFRSVSLKEVFNRVSRKYGVTFIVDDEIVLDDTYTGVFDEEEGDINEVMDILKENFKFKYRIKEDTIWIYYPVK